MASLYFKIKKSRVEYKGERYFKVDYDRPKVCQVCVSGGEPGRGRASSPGITMIDSTGFFSNYMGFYVEATTKALFDRKLPC